MLAIRSLDLMRISIMSRSGQRPSPRLVHFEQLEDRVVPAGMSIFGYIYEDTNQDGIKQDDEPGIPGSFVDLHRSDGTFITNAISDADGFYSFTDLAPGDYYIFQEQPEGYDDGLESFWVDGGREVIPGTIGTDRVDITLEAEGPNSAVGIDFGEYYTGGGGFEYIPASLSGIAYVDLNANGSFDDGEALSGVIMILEGFDDFGNQIYTETITDENGEYVFNDLAPGTYSLSQIQPEGYLDGADFVGSVDGIQMGIIDEGSDDRIVEIVLGSGSTGVGYNFSERPEVVIDDPPADNGEQTGNQGLTPGFWKNNAKKFGAIAWQQAGVSPAARVDSIFTSLSGSSLGSKTLLQALNLGGGGINALLRHAVAGYLNAKHPGVHYPITSSELTQAVNQAVNHYLTTGSKTQVNALKDQLENYNEQGADLNQHGNTDGSNPGGNPGGNGKGPGNGKGNGNGNGKGKGKC